MLEAAGNPSPYYWEVAENFLVPAIYFSPPEIDTGGDTLETYSMNYLWQIVCFHTTKQKAYSMAREVVTAIRGCRNLIPLIDEDGETTGRGLRINDPELKMADGDEAQLTLSWTSRRPYNHDEVEMMATYGIDIELKQS